MAFNVFKSPEFVNLYRDKCLRLLLESQTTKYVETNGCDNEREIPKPMAKWFALDKSGHKRYPLIQQELYELRARIKRELYEEKHFYWEGLQTTEEKRRSAHFQYVLNTRKRIICPICRQFQITDTDDGYLVCDDCGIRFYTKLSLHQIITRMEDIMKMHSNRCLDLFPNFHKFKSNLIIFCNSCSLSQMIL